MENIDFLNIIKQSKAQNVDPKSIDWFRKKALEISSGNKIDAEQFINNETRAFKRLVKLSETSVGKMYLFVYDPKYKQRLPYYDTYPLIFPIEYYGDSFLGLNLHYLPPLVRGRFLNLLFPLLTNDKYDKTTKLQISYKILKGATYNSYMKPCIKKYLFSHVRSRFLYISPDEWALSVMLPTQNFVKTTSGYEKSINIY